MMDGLGSMFTLSEMGKHFSFHGRVSRKGYWIYILVVFSLSLLVGFGYGLMFAAGVFDEQSLLSIFVVLCYIVYYVTMTIVGLSYNVRRAHDRGRTGWFVLLGFVPLLNLWVMVEFLFLPGEPNDNDYGPDPLAETPTQPGSAQTGRTAGAAARQAGKRQPPPGKVPPAQARTMPDKGAAGGGQRAPKGAVRPDTAAPNSPPGSAQRSAAKQARPKQGSGADKVACVLSVYLDGELQSTVELSVQDLARGVVAGRKADIQLLNPTVSRQHFKLQRSKSGQVMVTDLGSSAGTQLDGRMLTANQAGAMRRNSIIVAGQMEIHLEA